MDKEKTLNSLTILAQAYGFAKAGHADKAGELFVQAAAEDALDEVMDGVAKGAAELEASDDTDTDDNDTDDLKEFQGEPDAEINASAKDKVQVEMPESVARLAARTLV